MGFNVDVFGAIDWLKKYKKKAWNVPHPRNEDFTGRTEKIKQLSDNLLKWNKTITLTQVVEGMGGVGKTQIALEYAHRFQGQYKGVWWIRSEEPATLAKDYADLAQHLDISEDIIKSPDQQVKIAAVKDWLNNNSSWLFIFDNAEEQKALEPYFPTLHKGHVLVTTRNQNCQGGHLLQVDIMDEETAVEFLHTKTKLKNNDGAKELAETLGYLPLALEQAGAFIKERKKSYEEYLKLYTERQEELLKRGDNITDYEQTVFTTWDVSREKLEEESPAGASLLKLCAFFAPDDIPLDTIRKEGEFLPKLLQKAAEDDLAWDDALQAVKRYSLATIEKEELSLHRLLQSVMRHKMTKKEQKSFAGTAVKVLQNAYPFKEHQLETWEESGRLLPHAIAATNHAEELQSELGKTASLLDLAGEYLRIRADFEFARRLGERALMIGEKVHGKKSSEVALYANNLGSTFYQQGNLLKARELFEQALTIVEKVHGKEHSEVAIRLNNLGMVELELGSLIKARGLFQQALEIDETAYGKEHPKVAIRLNNLGAVEKDLGNLDEAKDLCQRALEIGETTYAKDHPKVANRLNNIALILKEEGNVGEARKLFQRALNILTTVHGSDHPLTIQCRKNIESLDNGS